jgi:hypothetical protein
MIDLTFFLVDSKTCFASEIRNEKKNIREYGERRIFLSFQKRIMELLDSNNS